MNSLSILYGGGAADGWVARGVGGLSGRAATSRVGRGGSSDNCGGMGGLNGRAERQGLGGEGESGEGESGEGNKCGDYVAG